MAYKIVKPPYSEKVKKIAAYHPSYSGVELEEGEDHDGEIGLKVPIDLYNEVFPEDPIKYKEE